MDDEDLASQHSDTDLAGALLPRADQKPQQTVERKNLSPRRKFLIVTCVALVIGGGPFILGCMGPFFTVDALAKNPGAETLYHTAVGGVYSVLQIAVLIATPLVTRELPFFGSKGMMVLFSATQGACSVLFAFMDDIADWRVFLAYCYCIRILQGAALVATTVSSLAYMIALYPNSLGFVNAFQQTFLCIGHGTGTLVGGTLYTVAGFRAPFIAAGLVMLLVAVAVGVAVVDVGVATGASSVGDGDGSAKEKHASVLTMLRVPWVWLMVVMLMLSNIAYSASEALLAPHLSGKYGASAFTVGAALGLQILLGALISPFVGFALDRDYNGRVLLATGLASLGVGCLFVGPSSALDLPSSLWLPLLSMAPLGFGHILVAVPSICDMSRHLERIGVGSALELRYAVAGLSRFALALGYAVGPVVMSPLVASIDFQASFTILGFVYLAMTVLLLMLMTCRCVVVKRKSKPQKPVSTSKEYRKHRAEYTYFEFISMAP